MGVVVVSAVLVGLMWVSFGRSIAGFDDRVASNIGEPFDASAIVTGSGADDPIDWIQSGPGDWAIGSEPAAGTLSLKRGDPDQATMALTRLPSGFNSRYELSFTVKRTSLRSGLVLAASDVDNRLELRDQGPLDTWTFVELLGGRKTTRATIEPEAFAAGDRITVRFDAPRVQVVTNGEPAASVRLDQPQGPIWVGFYGVEPGFSVSDVTLERP